MHTICNNFFSIVYEYSNIPKQCQNWKKDMNNIHFNAFILSAERSTVHCIALYT